MTAAAASPRLPMVLAAASMGYAAASSIWFVRVGGEFQLRYSDSLRPMLVEADGYFHLARAQAIVAGATSWLAEPPLSALAAGLHLLTSIPLESLAFWLPAALAVLTGCWTAGWARLLDFSRTAAAVSAFASALAPSWFLRACPGWFDTDPGIAFFWNGALYACACLCLAPGRPDRRHAATLLACFLGLAWWWRPGAFLAPLFLLCWGGGYRFCLDPFWRRVRLAALGLALLSPLLLLLPPALFPEGTPTLRIYLANHLGMLSGARQEAVFLSINELAARSPLELLEDLGGNPAAGALAVASALALCLLRGRAGWFLLPGLAAAPLALFSARLLYFAALPVALGLGALPLLARRLAARLPVAWRGFAPKPLELAAWALLLGVLASQARGLSSATLNYYFQTPQDRLALALKAAAPAQARLWNWWDDGYFLAARSGLQPYFDGGSQTPRKSYIAAHPLLSDDPVFARRWMRFFALRGDNVLYGLMANWGGEANTWRNLDAIFSAPDMAAVLKTLPDSGQFPEWFAPQGRVFLYLPQRFLRISKWWMGLGAAPHPDASGFRWHIDAFRKDGFVYDAAAGRVALPKAVLDKGYRDFGKVYVTSREPLAQPWGGGVPGPYIVTSDHTPWLYIVDEAAIRSLGFRLLAPGGAPIAGFAPVLVDPAAGGVWELLP